MLMVPAAIKFFLEYSRGFIYQEIMAIVKTYSYPTLYSAYFCNTKT